VQPTCAPLTNRTKIICCWSYVRRAGRPCQVRFKYGCRTFHSLDTYMFVNHTTPVRLTHFYCKIGVLASYGTYSFPEVYPELMTEHLGIVLSISMVTPLQQLTACLGSAHSQVFVICNFDTSFLLLNCSGNYCLYVISYAVRYKDCDTLAV
jgi:hypothetical protein